MRTRDQLFRSNSEAMSEFETSKEERLQIAQHFLLSSPPGQFHEVLGDVRKLMKDGILTESLETGIARVYNTKNGKVVSAPSGTKTVLSAAGEVDNTHYVDPSNGAVFAIDHITLVSFKTKDRSRVSVAARGATHIIRF